MEADENRVLCPSKCISSWTKSGVKFLSRFHLSPEGFVSYNRYTALGHA